MTKRTFKVERGGKGDGNGKPEEAEGSDPFEALDEDFMELQRERTFVNYMPGETPSTSNPRGSRRPTTSSASSGLWPGR